MITLNLEVEKAREAYNKGSKDQKQFLIDMYGKEHFLLETTDRVTDYLSACEELNIKPLSFAHFSFLPEEDQERAWNRHQLSIGTRALCGVDYKPDFTKSNEYKYYNYIYWDTDKSGFSSGCINVYYAAFVGSDLYIENYDKAKIIEKIFRDDYIIYLF